MAMTSKRESAEVDGGLCTTIASLFQHQEQGLLKNPDGPAVIAMHQTADHLGEFLDQPSSSCPPNGRGVSCLTWTYRHIHEASLKLVTALLERGISPGSTLVTLVPHGIEWCLWMWTASIMRFTVAPLDLGALNQEREAELQHYMTQINPAIVLVSDVPSAKAVDIAIAASGVSRPFSIKLTGDDLDQWTPLEALASSRPEDSGIDLDSLLASARESDPDRIGLILFTSGTSSGKPKGCLLHVGGTTYIVDTQQLGPKPFDTSSRWLMHTANFRVIAPTFMFLTWTAGGAVVIPGLSFNAEQDLDAVEQHRVTNVLFVPAMIHAIAARPDFKNRDVSSIRGIAVGGDMITRDILTKIQALFPESRIMAAHGMTEGGGFFQWPFFSEPLNDVPYFGEISPLGTVSRGARVRVWETESQRVAKLGEPGELHISCMSITKGYLGGVNAESFYEEHGRKWFKTGDLAMINSESLVYILGRVKDVVKRAGVPITPAAIESCLERYTGSQTTVVGIYSPFLGQEPFAVLQSFAGKTETDIEQHVVKSFGPDYALAGATTLQDLGMEHFPLNATGKIMKIVLVKALEDKLHK